MIKKIVGSCLAVVFLLGLAQSQTTEENPAVERLKEASSLKRTSFKQAPEKKKEILLKTVECYRSVCNDFPEDRAACSEAGFRMGEILRTLKQSEEAKRAFEQSVEFDPASRFAARALKEIGHLHRRAKEYDQAMACYRRVLSECTDWNEDCADALTWIGKVHLKQGEHEKARTILVSFADTYPQFPDEAIRNIDLAAESYLDEGNREKAEELLSRWRQHFESQMGKDERLDKKIEKALERMKTPEQLKS